MFIFLTNVGWGQTNIASDGLNNSTTLFTLSGGSYYTGTTSSTADAPASSAYAVEGTHSRGIGNGTATLTTSDINTNGYSSIQMSFGLASYSVGSTGNGADGSDIVTVEVSPNGGINYYSTIRVIGNNNARWSWSSGTGNASTAYDGNSTSVDFTPSGGGARTTDGYGTVTITGLPTTTNLKIRVTLLNNSPNERWLLDDFKVTGTASSTPTLNAVTLGTALSTTYGTATAGVSFSAAGSNLTGNITATAQSGYEVSTSSGSGYGSSVSVASGTLVYVRFAAAKSAGNYNGVTAVVLSSSGATDANVTTSASSNTVNTKALTITGLSASDKQYDATTSVTVSGTPAYSGLANSESFSVSGTPTWVFGTKTVGTNKTISQTGSYTAPSANYTVTQPTLTATITAKVLTLSGAAASNKMYDATTTATITGTLSGVIAGDAVTLTGTGTFASANVGTGIAVTSTSTLAGADNANYSLTQPTGLSANITQASQTIVFGALPAKTTADVPFACGATSATSGTNALTYSSSNAGVATINSSGTITIVGVGITTITVSQAGSSNYSPAADVAQTLTVTVPPCFSENFSSITTGNSTSTSGSNTSWVGNSNFTTVSSAYEAGGAVRLGASGNTGSITSSTLSGVSGDVTVSFDVKGWTTVEGNISVTLNGSTQTVTYTAVMSGSFENKSVQFIGVPSNSTLTFATTAKRAFIDNIVLTCQASTSVSQAVSTSAASSIVNTTAILNGNLTTVGVSPNTTEKGFVYSQTSTNSTPEVGGTGVTKTSVAGISTGAYTLSLAELSTNTGYSFRAYAYDGTTYTYGPVLTFTTLTVASKLGFGTTPPANGSLSTNLTTFTVQALRSDNTLDTEFSGAITVAKATGAGNISGTLTGTASAGVATFSSVQFDALGDYTIIASSGALTTVTSSTITILAYAVGDYRTRASGNWGANTTWEKWNGSAWVACSIGDFPDISTASVIILNGHTVDNDESGTPPWDVNHLTVETGAKLWDGAFGGVNSYIQLYGNVVCNGTIGDPNGDDISFDIAGGNNCTIAGTGSFTATRIRKDASINSSTDASLTIDMDIRLTWSSSSGAVLYNDGSSSNFNVIINSGKTVRGSGPGSALANVAIDGNNFSIPDPANSGGSITVNGTLDIDGILYAYTDNSIRPCEINISNGGTVKCRYIRTGNSGSAGSTLRIFPGGKLNIFGSVDTVSATLVDTTWRNFSIVNNTWDFQTGSTIEYSGVTQQRVNGISACSNFIVSGGGLKKLGNDFTVSGILTLANGRVQTDAYKLIHTSTSAAELTHTTGSSSFIYGTYRRYITSNTSSYEMPVGLSSSTSGYRRADLVNNGLVGLSYVDASVRSVTESANNVDSRITCTQEGSTLTDVVGNTVWSLVPDVAPSGGSYGVRLYVDGLGMSAADDNTFCPVKRNTGSTDYADWNTFFATTTIPNSGSPGRVVDGGNGYAQRLGYTSFSEHAIGKTPTNQPLPVELVSFTAECLNESKVQLQWITATEHNSSHFVMERSVDGDSWSIIGVMNASGYSNELLTYHIEDRIEANMVYYRLSQVDVNGEEVIYAPISLLCNTENSRLITIPNPSGKSFTVAYFADMEDQPVVLQVTDAHGKSLYAETHILSNGVNSILISGWDWAPGIYFVKLVTSEGKTEIVKHQLF